MSSQLNVPNVSVKSSFVSLKNKKFLLLIVLLLGLVGGVFYYIKFIRNKDSFEGTENSPSAKFVLYYASWCGWSNKFLPTWEELDNNSKLKQKVNLVKLTCDKDDKDECDKAGLEGFPTMKYFKDENDTEGKSYEGKREADDIVNWINGM